MYISCLATSFSTQKERNLPNNNNKTTENEKKKEKKIDKKSETEWR